VTKKLLDNVNHVLKCGGTGTGKSLNCEKLRASFSHTQYITLSLTFSARTTVDTIHNNLNPILKRRKLGVFGPENSKKGLINIDDLNMPKKEEFGAQPPLELLRQWFDYKGW